MKIKEENNKSISIKKYEKISMKEYIFRQLLSINIVDPEIRKTHLRTIENNVYRKNVATQQGKCPRCGGNLVFRNGKYGKFWGCSNYPKCTYTHK